MRNPKYKKLVFKSLKFAGLWALISLALALAAQLLPTINGGDYVAIYLTYLTYLVNAVAFCAALMCLKCLSDADDNLAFYRFGVD